MEIPKLELNDLLEGLESDQAKAVQKIIEDYNTEDVMEKYLDANGPTFDLNTLDISSSLQLTQLFTSEDGSDIRLIDASELSKKFLESFKQEFNKFLCGHDAYKDDREKVNKEISTIGDKLGPYLVSSLSSVLAIHFGLAVSAIAPLVVLALYVAGKMGINAYCNAFYIPEPSTE